MVFKDKYGHYRFKIVLYGPSLSGKTTMLKILYNKIRGLKKGRLRMVADQSGRTIFFDYLPLKTSGNIFFDLYTVPGQRRHKTQRRLILKGADSVVFVADSDPEALEENIYSIQELRTFLGNEWGEIPIVVALNKRDLPDALPEVMMLRVMRLDGPYPVFKTVAIEGLGVKRVFQEACRLAVLARIFPEAFKREIEILARETRRKLGL